MVDGKLRAARLISVIAATLISLSCGTNYAYSAWAPDFAARMKLSSTQSNLIGTFANLGMYGAGIPVGLFVDSKGPRPGVLFGAILMGLGYILLRKAYDGGPGSMAMPLLCFLAFLTGVGGAAAFFGALKTAALNYPTHRGTATAFPLSAYGLSAFFYATVSSLAFGDNPSKLLLLLAAGTFSMCFVGFFFLRVVSHPSGYSAIPGEGERRRSQSTRMTRSKSRERKHSTANLSHEPGRQPVARDENTSRNGDFPKGLVENPKSSEMPSTETEISSLISKSSSSIPGDDSVRDKDGRNNDEHNSRYVDIRGFALLPTIEFWQLFLMLGLLTGVGLMTINNIGNDAKALWNHYDDSTTPEFIQKQQMMHVSVLSILSFIGRLLSGVGSDIIVKKLHMSRFWCLFASSCIFCVGQICGARVHNPHMLVFVSGLNGLAYGFLFGVYPSIVAEVFGVHGLSQNWGWMTLAPVIAGNIFNLLYGRIYDSHSIILPDGRRDCREALDCYSAAYWITFGASFASVMLSLWSIRHNHVTKAMANRNEGVNWEA